MRQRQLKRLKLNRDPEKHEYEKMIKHKRHLNRICYPPHHSEFEVQAELYKELSMQGFDVRGCVPARCIDFHNHPKVYFDLVVFKDRKPIVIIECKNDGTTDLELKPGTRQYRRYHYFGLPVLKCGSVEAIEDVVLKVDYCRLNSVALFGH